ncbi:sce7726 family protein [Naumannella cuiyingiana]|uniref:sce7726 family protein n=1 Tax=Naumannella cuiyingiana TaxID=1347891 RepID=UPI0015CE25EB
MHDQDLRVAMHAHLRALHAGEKDTLILNEFSVDGLDRIDLAAINDHLTGYELKSARDSLVRLERQVWSYGRVMDYITIVTTSGHMRRALEIVPSWWGIISAAPSRDEICLNRARKARRNPHVNTTSLAGLLWRDEALQVLTRHGIDSGVRTKSRAEICQRLATEMTLAQLRQEVTTKIRARRGWRESPEPLQSGATLPSSGTTPRFLARRLVKQHH